jgi:diguanylate cyclase (GGDEF)-like protein
MASYTRFLICAFLGLYSTFHITDVSATPTIQETSLDISRPQIHPIGNHLTYIQTKNKLSPLAAYEKLNKEGIHSTMSVLNFGITSNTVWLQFSFQNPTSKPLSRILWTESIWLDKVVFYKINKEQNITTPVATIGDVFPFSTRTTDHRQLSFYSYFPPGKTSFLVKVTNNDPTLLNFWVSSEKAFNLQNNHITFSYGILYGAILSLLIYNLLMFISIKQSYHLYFSLYLFSFLISNLGYSGYAFMWFWPNSPMFEQYAILFLMVLYGITGIIFALDFLKLNTPMASFSKVLHWTNGLILLIFFIFAAFDYHIGCAVIAFAYIPFFSVTMLLIGFIALRQNNSSAKYFILATMAGAIGASITSLTVAGVLPFTYFGFRAVDIGVSLDVVLLAFTVAYKFRRSEEARAIAELTASTDPLTLLDNRRAFNEKVSKLWLFGKREKSPSSVIIIDIDHFKEINDKYSHDAGDNVLIKIAKILKGAVRDSDVLCRWGGEEFLIYLPETNEIGACNLADKIKMNMNAAIFNIDKVEIKVSASFGVSEREKMDKKVGEVINRSDKALYVAKGSGRNRFQAWSELAVANCT